MNNLESLFDNNIRWANKIKAEDPTFFEKLAAQQQPEYLWIGCSDSRVPANEIVGLLPGELFVHGNIANTVVHTDLNCLSVIYYAVAVLKVKHIIVCGHYGCGGVHAAMGNTQVGLVDHWLRNIRDVYRIHKDELNAIENEEEKYNRLVELNVREQCVNVLKTADVQKAYRKRGITVHGWIFDIHSGKIIDLNIL